jgi:hypothetical protein
MHIVNGTILILMLLTIAMFLSSGSINQKPTMIEIC